MTENQAPDPAQVAPVSLLEAIDYALNQAPCECPHSMRFERGEHMSGCYLFDLNVEYAKTAPAIPAPEGGDAPTVSVPEGLARSDAEFWLRHRGAIIDALRAEGLSIVSTAHGVHLMRLGKIVAQAATPSPAEGDADLPPLPPYIYGRECGKNERVYTAAQMYAYGRAAQANVQSKGMEPLHLGACLKDGKLYATVMRRESNGHITVVATAEIDESWLRAHDCHAVMAPSIQAPAPAPEVRPGWKLTPSEATPEMLLAAGWSADSASGSAMWRDMHAAAPSPAVGADTKRLDWMQETQNTPYRMVHEAWEPLTDGSGHRRKVVIFDGWCADFHGEPYPTIREAIDAAMGKTDVPVQGSES